MYLVTDYIHNVIVQRIIRWANKYTEFVFVSRHIYAAVLVHGIGRNRNNRIINKRHSNAVSVPVVMIICLDNTYHYNHAHTFV